MTRRRQKPARRTVAALTFAEIGAIGELLSLLDVFLESLDNKPDERIVALCAMVAERVAEILRNGGLHPVDDETLAEFVSRWEADKPARFNR